MSNLISREDVFEALRRQLDKTNEVKSKCMIDGHYIGYVQCFTNWCLHWATDELKWKGGDDE